MADARACKCEHRQESLSKSSLNRTERRVVTGNSQATMTAAPPSEINMSSLRATAQQAAASAHAAFGPHRRTVERRKGSDATRGTATGPPIRVAILRNRTVFYLHLTFALHRKRFLTFPRAGGSVALERTKMRTYAPREPQLDKRVAHLAPPHLAFALCEMGSLMRMGRCHESGRVTRYRANKVGGERPPTGLNNPISLFLRLGRLRPRCQVIAVLIFMILDLIFAHGFHRGLRHAAVGSLLPGHAVLHSLLPLRRRWRRIITDSLTANTYEPHKQCRCHFVRHLAFPL
jgi:hypothetical protein